MPCLFCFKKLLSWVEGAFSSSMHCHWKKRCYLCTVIGLILPLHCFKPLLRNLRSRPHQKEGLSTRTELHLIFFCFCMILHLESSFVVSISSCKQHPSSKWLSIPNRLPDDILTGCAVRRPQKKMTKKRHLQMQTHSFVSERSVECIGRMTSRVNRNEWENVGE